MQTACFFGKSNFNNQICHSYIGNNYIDTIVYLSLLLVFLVFDHGYCVRIEGVNWRDSERILSIWLFIFSLLTR